MLAVQLAGEAAGTRNATQLMLFRILKRLVTLFPTLRRQ